MSLYDRIGSGYRNTRRADPRITGHLLRLLGLQPGSTVVDVGAGTGNYAAALAAHGMRVTAIEPSGEMRRAAVASDAAWIAAVAEALPFRDSCFDGAVMVLAAHHLAGRARAFRELRRAVRGPVVVLTFDESAAEPFWLAGYFPEQWNAEPEARSLPRDVAALEAAGYEVTVDVMPLPHDVQDGFKAAGWRRPGWYLDPASRDGISGFRLADPASVKAGVARLAADLESGAWEARFGAILQRETFDAGYRLVRAVPGSPVPLR